MNAIQFIKDHGIDKAREVAEGIPNKYMSCYYSTICYCTKSNKYSDRFKPRESLVNIGWLKRLIESVDLVKSYGGIINAKHDVRYLDLDWDYDTPRVTRLKQAIADYESIYLQEKCQHGYDIACLLCGFGTVDGKRVYHGGADSK